jgi:hypothetical protein
MSIGSRPLRLKGIVKGALKGPRPFDNYLS